MVEPDEVVVRRAREGDREAFRSLFERYRDPIYSYVRRMVGPEAADDLAQDVFVRAYQALPRLKAPGAFRGWLYQIAANRVRDHWKLVRPETVSLDVPAGDDGYELAVADAGPGPEGVAVRKELSAAIEQAVAALPPERREVVLLHHLRGLDVRAIAGILGIAEGTVKSRLGRARAELRVALADWMEE